MPPPLNRRTFLTHLGTAAISVPLTSALRAADPRTRTADVCVYAGHAAGIAAAGVAASLAIRSDLAVQHVD